MDFHHRGYYYNQQVLELLQDNRDPLSYLPWGPTIWIPSQLEVLLLLLLQPQAQPFPNNTTRPWRTLPILPGNHNNNNINDNDNSPRNRHLKTFVSLKVLPLTQQQQQRQHYQQQQHPTNLSHCQQHTNLYQQQ